MKNLEFLVFALLLFSGVVAGHMALQMTLNEDPALMKQIERTEQAKHEADLRADLAEDRLADFRQQVATLLPVSGMSESDASGADPRALKANASTQATQKNNQDASAAQRSKVEESYPLRQLASVVQQQRDLDIERASSLLEKGKAEFRDGEYERSNSIFADLIQRYPDSVHVAEAHFLLAEGQFKTKDYESSIATIEKMIALFPENELTGFALLRLGRIYELQDRLEDAGDIYKSVLTNFKRPQWHELQRQAQASLQGVRL